MQPWSGHNGYGNQGQAHYSPYNPYAYGVGILPPSFGHKLSPTLAAAHEPYEPVSPLFLYGHGQLQYTRPSHVLGPEFILPSLCNGKSFVETDTAGGFIQGPSGVSHALEEVSGNNGDWAQPRMGQQGLDGEQIFAENQAFTNKQGHSTTLAGRLDVDESEAGKQTSRPAYSAPRDPHTLSGRPEGGSIEDMGSFESPNGFVLQSLVDLINH